MMMISAKMNIKIITLMAITCAASTSSLCSRFHGSICSLLENQTWQSWYGNYYDERNGRTFRNVSKSHWNIVNYKTSPSRMVECLKHSSPHTWRARHPLHKSSPAPWWDRTPPGCGWICQSLQFLCVMRLHDLEILVRLP